MGGLGSEVLLILSLALLLPGSQQLQASQVQVLQQLRKHLQYPRALDAWNNIADICGIPSSPELSIVCNGDSVVELKIVGERLSKAGEFWGVAIPNQTLSSDFSMDSFVTTLTRLTSLKAVSLVSLGMWGLLPDKIHRLGSLEAIDLSSNFLYGSLADKMSTMGSLQTWIMDNNFLNGTLPDWFNNFANLSILSMKNNRFDGPMPRSISAAKALTVLALSGNGISGSIPDLGALTKLQVLDLRDNKLESNIPVLPGSLFTVLLSKNSLSSKIPGQFVELRVLQHLDLSYNFLQGQPPPAIFSLPNISYLNLAMNMLSGSLPSNLICSSELGFVDVSSNRFTGVLPSCLSSHSDKRVVVYSGNCLSTDPPHQHKSSYCEGLGKQGKNSTYVGTWILIGVVGGLVFCLLLLGVLSLGRCRKYWKRKLPDQHLLPQSVPVMDNSSTGFSSELLMNARYIQTMKVGTLGFPIYRQFTVAELEEATSNFSRSSYMGENSFGKIYKGRLENGTYVAVRCFTLFKKHQIRNLKLRLDLLSKLRHPHLVCLLGHCIDGAPDESRANRAFLVYEYVSSGTLPAYIFEKSLKWSEKLSVLIGVAKAVHFLHTGIIPGLFHNQLRSKNILTDEHGISKLSDYGLSIFSEELAKLQAREDGFKLATVDSRSAGRQAIDVDDDVYSFGLILLETLVGSTTFEREESGVVADVTSSFSTQDEWKRILDPVVLCTSAQESLSTVISITNKCLSIDPSARPSIEDVLWNLLYAAQVQATADGEQRPEEGVSA